MKNFREYTPFFSLVFLVCAIGYSTYKSNLRQKTRQQNIRQENIDSISNQNSIPGFVKTEIILPEFSLPDLYNKEGSFSKKDLLGKYSLINLFASWCTTCHAEHNILLRLKEKLKYEDNMNIYGVAWRDISQNTRKYLEKSGNPYVKVASDNKALFTKLVGVKAVPETLIIDPQGKVILRYSGNLQEFMVDDLAKIITKKP